jgi:hypothetical protein
MAEHPGVQVTVVRFLDGKAGRDEHAEVTLRPSEPKNAEKSYTFSTAVVNGHREKVTNYRLQLNGGMRCILI